MKQMHYWEVYEDFKIDLNDYFYVEGTLLALQFSQDIRLINGRMHKFIKTINLN